jgi:hypothetical protein
MAATAAALSLSSQQSLSSEHQHLLLATNMTWRNLAVLLERRSLFCCRLKLESCEL